MNPLLRWSWVFLIHLIARNFGHNRTHMFPKSLNGGVYLLIKIPNKAFKRDSKRLAVLTFVLNT